MIKVFNVSDLIKYVIKLLAIFVLIFFLMQFFSVQKKDTDKNSKALLFCIEDSLPQIKVSNNNEKEKVEHTNGLKYTLISELEILNSLKIEENEEQKVANQEEAPKEENKTDSTEVNENDKVTEVINSGVNPRYTDEYQGVFINNQTQYTLTEDILTPNVEVNKKKVVILHTHTCESYTPTENFQYEASGSFRTTDLNYSVCRVGDELAKNLEQYGITVVHDKTYHDYPAYNGSYNRSLVTARNVLSSNQDADIVIDLHRDAIADETYAPKVKIGDKYASQLMFVMGTDLANSAHKNWSQNLKFAIKVQKKANELYPGLFKPIILRNSSYNQHVSKAACIIEVGSTGNTLEESIEAMKYLAKIIKEI